MTGSHLVDVLVRARRALKDFRFSTNHSPRLALDEQVRIAGILDDVPEEGILGIAIHALRRSWLKLDPKIIISEMEDLKLREKLAGILVLLSAPTAGGVEQTAVVLTQEVERDIVARLEPMLAEKEKIIQNLKDQLAGKKAIRQGELDDLTRQNADLRRKAEAQAVELALLHQKLCILRNPTAAQEAAGLVYRRDLGWFKTQLIEVERLMHAGQADEAILLLNALRALPAGLHPGYNDTEAKRLIAERIERERPRHFENLAKKGA